MEENTNVTTTEVTDVTISNGENNLGVVIILGAAAAVGSLATIGIQKGSKAVKKLWKKHKDNKTKRDIENEYVDGDYEEVDDIPEEETEE